MSTQSDAKAARRTQILEAALGVFAERGYHGTRVEDIAAAAGVSKGTIYLYFESRDAILRAAFDRFIEEVDGAVEQAMGSDRPPLDKLRALVRRVLERMEAQETLSRVLVDFWAAGLHDRSQPTIDFKPIYARWRRQLTALLEEAAARGDLAPDVPEHAATMTIALVEGLQLQWLADPDAVPLADAGKRTIDAMIDGLAP